MVLDVRLFRSRLKSNLTQGRNALKWIEPVHSSRDRIHLTDKPLGTLYFATMFAVCAPQERAIQQMSLSDARRGHRVLSECKLVFLSFVSL